MQSMSSRDRKTAVCSALNLSIMAYPADTKRVGNRTGTTILPVSVQTPVLV